MAAAVEIATRKQQEGSLPAELQREIKEILDPQLPWKEVLARFLTEHVRNDYEWTRPNPRYIQGRLYLPSLGGQQLGEVVVFIDNSGSISAQQQTEMVLECLGILAAYKTKLTVVFSDAAVNAVNVLESGDEFKPQIKGGGGTDYRPAFQWVEKENLAPVVAIYLTDGWCHKFPTEEPGYPVLWVLTISKGFIPPFGEVI